MESIRLSPIRDTSNKRLLRYNNRRYDKDIDLCGPCECLYEDLVYNKNIKLMRNTDILNVFMFLFIDRT